MQALMIPSRVFVGDRAILVLPLPDFAGQAATALARFSASPDIDIHRVTLEQRSGTNHLTIEFSAFVPGILELPPIEIAGEIFSGLQVEISSVLDSSDMSSTVLSGLAVPMAVPGTSLLVYGTMSASVAALLLALWALFWGRRQLRSWLAAWKRWRLLALMWGIEKRLRKALAKGIAKREILDILSREFRSFLSHFTGKNCRAMTASEFGGDALPDSEFLEGFFSRCDRARFKGNEISGGEAQALLDDLRSFLGALVKTRKEAA